jgi:hypothetical protein
MPFMLLYKAHLWQILVVNDVHGLENKTACTILLAQLFDHATGDSPKVYLSKLLVKVGRHQG